MAGVSLQGLLSRRGLIAIAAVLGWLGLTVQLYLILLLRWEAAASLLLQVGGRRGLRRVRQLRLVRNYSALATRLDSLAGGAARLPSAPARVAGPAAAAARKPEQRSVEVVRSGKRENVTY